MNNSFKIILWIIGAGIVAAGVILWLVYFHTPTLTTDTAGLQFGTGNAQNNTNVTPSNITDTPATETPGIGKIFKIADGPVAGATLIDTTRPTSTIARYVMQTNGHAFDLVLDSPGAVPKSISNTTVPGIKKVLWSGGGTGALMQYIDIETVKTVHFALPPASSTTTIPVRVQFLPGNIASLAVSPDGANVAYLLKTARGGDVYTARADGGDAKNLVSLPLSEIALSWPEQGTLLAGSAPASGVTGAIFSINAKTGAYAPLMFAQGLTAIADRAFSRIVYQTEGAGRSTYYRTVKTGLSSPLSFDPSPESCIWSMATSTTMYCAVPLSYVETNYLDLVHQGIAGKPSSVVSYDLINARSSIVAVPGGAADGGEQADIAEMAITKSEKYLIYIRKSDRSLWAVRLTQ